MHQFDSALPADLHRRLLTLEHDHAPCSMPITSGRCGKPRGVFWCATCQRRNADEVAARCWMHGIAGACAWCGNTLSTIGALRRRLNRNEAV